MKVKIVSDPLSSFPVSIHCPFFLSPLVSFFSYHVTSKSLNNIHSYNGMYLPKFIQNKILWSTPISQIEQCTTTLIKYQRLQGACYRSPGSLTAFINKAPALWRPSWWESATAGHNFGRGPSNDSSIKVWF